MPQATDELRVEWGGVLGVGEDKAIAHLERRGYRLTQHYTWKKPKFVTPTLADQRAVLFLIQEWDFGGMHD